MGKAKFDAQTGEIGWVQNDILYITKNLAKWVKDESIPDMPLAMMPMGYRIKKEPLGTVLVIGAYNYPVQLALGPLLGAIAAGCTAVLKPSEQCPHVAMVLTKVCSVLDSTCFAVVQGGVPESTKLLDQTWDKIFYTGGAQVGKIIAKKAAETLTPTTLELGGKNPAIITKNADIKLAARRLLWAKHQNAGQICLSQNYHLVERSVLPQLIKEFGNVYKEFYPNGVAASPDFPRIATDRGWQRLKHLLDTTSGKIIYGGNMDEKTRFIELTVVEVDDVKDPLVADEHFGPIMVLLAVDSVDEAIRIANEVDPTPLTAYAFGAKAETDKILEHVRSGGATVNDTLFHAANPIPPFGGLKTSGQGTYRGKASYEAFTHRRVVATTPGWVESLIKMRYPPYTDAKLKQFQSTGQGKPNFDRNGNVNYSLWNVLFSRKLLSFVALISGK